MEIERCPSTLAKGYQTYSPLARKILFDDKEISPFLDLDSPAIQPIDIKESVGRISLSGVQPKMGMVLGNDNKLRYNLVNERSTYIAKPKPQSYHLMRTEDCPANENLTMQMAFQVYGIETAANGLIFYKSGEIAYLTRRFDVNGAEKLQQEDFASLMGLSKDRNGDWYKYENASYEDCGLLIRKHVKAWMVDVLRFFRIVVFNFLTLNDDAHLKNFSLIYKDGEWRLTPAYDLLNTSLHLYEPRIFALSLGLFREGMPTGDVNSISRKDFEEFGRRIGLPKQLIKRELDKFEQPYPLAKELIENSFLTKEAKRSYWLSFDYRRKMLTF